MFLSNGVNIMLRINKSILIGATLIIVLAVSLWFRDQIYKFLSFESGLPSNLEISTDNPLVAEKPKETTLAKKAPEKPPTPSYSGRDPGEIRPVPEEVKLFTEEQKNELYARIREHAAAVKTDPGYFFGWIQVGIFKKTIGDFIGARDAWEYAGVIQPKNSLSFANLGELYWRYLRDYEQAEKNLKISIEHKPEDTQTHVTLAELYHYSLKEKYDLADDVLLDGLKANPGNETLMRRLAYLYEQRKEYVLAIEWWEKVLKQSPGDPEVTDSINKLRR